MDHVAIMNPKTCPVADIISGKKTIESRWYINRSAPWDKIKEGDTIYFKESGKPVSAKAYVERFEQYENLTFSKTKEIVDKYGTKISPVHMDDFVTHIKHKKFCVLIFLAYAQKITPFEINKKGFGNAAAWLVVRDIKTIKRDLV